MGYLKIDCNVPGAHRAVEDWLCIAVGEKKIPDSSWWDYDRDENCFTIMGITMKEAEKLIRFIYEHIPLIMKRDMRFKLVGYDLKDVPKPKSNWEAIDYMLQSFPKKKRIP